MEHFAAEPGGDRQARIVVAGGGVAALEAILALRALALDRVAIEVVAPDSEFVYRPLAVAEPFRMGEVRAFPLAPLVEAAGAHLRRGRVVAVDADRHSVTLDDGIELEYDFLLLTLGARPVGAVANALTFRGPADEAALAELLAEAVRGDLRRIVFALPAGASWPLPLYELALLTENFLTDRGTRGVEVSIVTPEHAPLAIFGVEASNALHELLEIRGIVLFPGVTPLRFESGALLTAPDGRIAADRVVALPQLEGPSLPGIPHNVRGFVPTDDLSRVVSQADVYAAGDMTLFPLKQGGIATQQADSAASDIAARVGADVEPIPFRPVLRGLLLTGMAPRFLRTEVGTGSSTVDTTSLWWPPAKIVGRYLAPFLAEQLGLETHAPAPPGAVAVDVALDRA